MERYIEINGIVYLLKDLPQQEESKPESKEEKKKSVDDFMDGLDDEVKKMLFGSYKSEEGIGHGYGAINKDVEESSEEIELQEILTDFVFNKQLSTTMLDNKYDRVLPKRKRGKLDDKNLWKVGANQINVFKKKDERKNKKYSILLLVDESGSMCGSKSRIAAEVSVFLANAFDKINGINFEIVGFNRYIHDHKKFDKKADLSKIKRNLIQNARGTGAGDNDDYDAILEGLDRLHRQDGKKILMTFSDGHPAAGNPWGTNENGESIDKDDFDVIKNMIKMNKKDVTCVGVGICDDSVEYIYPQSFVVDNLEEFKPKVLDFFRKNIKRG